MEVAWLHKVLQSQTVQQYLLEKRGQSAPFFFCSRKKLKENCIFFLKMFGSYEKMLIFAPNFMLLMREFSLSMRGRGTNLILWNET